MRLMVVNAIVQADGLCWPSLLAQAELVAPRLLARTLVCVHEQFLITGAHLRPPSVKEEPMAWTLTMQLLYGPQIHVVGS